MIASEKITAKTASVKSPSFLTRSSSFTQKIRSLTNDLIDYNGFWFPNSFTEYGMEAEYWALRKKAVLMDLSVVRKVDILGKDALSLLQVAFSRDLSKLTIGQAIYGCLLNPHGGIIDDGIVYQLAEADYRYVGNCDGNEIWLDSIAQKCGFQVMIYSSSHEWDNLAIQGPRSRDILRPLVELNPGFGAEKLDDLTYFRFATGTVAGIPALISRTGYTGELGYEIFVHPQDGADLWAALMENGEPEGLIPMGMLALDCARIEAGLLAIGEDFDDLTSPYQAGIGWVVALKKPDFIGKAALEKIKLHPPRVAVGLVLEGDRVALRGHSIYPVGEEWRVGMVTSATFSPILNRSIAIAQIVPEYAAKETELEIDFDDGMKHRVKATVGSLAAYDPTKSRIRA